MMADVIGKPEDYYRFPRREMLKYVPDGVRRVLDIGCGEGVFGRELKKSRDERGEAIEVTGIELLAERAAIAATHLDRVLVADVEHDNLSLPVGYYDCIILNDVLEHLISPWSVLKKLHLYLSDGGYVVSSIPNVRFWGVIKGLIIDGDWKYQVDGVLDITHLRFFTRRSILRMFEECGYDVLSIDGINQMVRGWKIELLRLCTAGALDDLKYWQFAVVARKKLAGMA